MNVSIIYHCTFYDMSMNFHFSINIRKEMVISLHFLNGILYMGIPFKNHCTLLYNTV